MLKSCPECKLQISDKASFCPHCGFPFKETPKRPYVRKAHRRLPNGFGQISKINKPLRKPYRAMVTVGKTQEGKPIVKSLKPAAYFATYNEAYEALLKYNKDHVILPTITVAELYEKWSLEYFDDIAPSTARTYRLAFKYSEKYHKSPISSVGIVQIREIIDAVPLSAKVRVLGLFSQMYDYAVGYGYLDKNIARLIKLPKSVAKDIEAERRPHLAFRKDELKTLWENKNDMWAAIILIQCYTGFRPQELVNITVSDVNLEERVIHGGMKTAAGKNRTVPIHPGIFDLVKDRCQNSKDGKLVPVKYNTYHVHFKETITRYGLDLAHRPHDPRKTFVTLAKEHGVDDIAIKRIIGHAIDDLTEKIYTERPISWLLDEISKIPV